MEEEELIDEEIQEWEINNIKSKDQEEDVDEATTNNASHTVVNDDDDNDEKSKDNTKTTIDDDVSQKHKIQQEGEVTDQQFTSDNNSAANNKNNSIDADEHPTKYPTFVSESKEEILLYHDTQIICFCSKSHCLPFVLVHLSARRRRNKSHTCLN